jgi:ABC-type glycerol-3-phosphate transport system substrate-binding protein
MRAKFWYLIVVLIILSGCDILERDSEDPSSLELTATPTLSATPTLQPTPIATEPVVQPAQLNLNVWLVSDVTNDLEVPGGSVLAQQLATFDDKRPNVNLNIEVKSPTGQGGTLSYLRTGRNVAPTILPDLIILPADQLNTAAAEQLIYPLDGHLTADQKDELFPAARSMAQVDNMYFGYPFTLNNLGHMAYNTNVLTDTVPATWDDLLLNESSSLIIPGAGASGAELALQMYLASGGSLVTEANQPNLEVEPLTVALDHVSRASMLGRISVQSSNVGTLAEAWQFLEDGVANMAQTDENLYLQESATNRDVDFAELPSLDQRLEPLVDGWAWAISTPDPARQELSAELMAWLIESQNLGEWSLAASTLPGRRSAFDLWPSRDPYVEFLENELDRAQPFPVAANADVMDALSSAIFDVLTLAKSPQLAAEEAAISVQ